MSALVPDNAQTCPMPMTDIQAYLALEDGDGEEVALRDLSFLRTAQVKNTGYWIWEYRTQDGEHNYLTVSADQRSVCIGVRGGRGSMTPEQLILADFLRIV